MGINRFFAICFACVCLTSFAYAYEAPFDDIDESSPYYDAVLWAHEENIAKGKSNNIFDADADVSPTEFAIFLGRAVTGDDNLVAEEYIERLIDAGIFKRANLPSTQGDAVTVEYAAKHIFAAYGVSVYKEKLYYYFEGVHDSAAKTAVEFGLLDADIDAKSPISRGQVVSMLYRLARYTNANATEFDDIFIVEDKNAEDLPLCYLALEQIPKAVLDAFRDDGWTLRFDTKYIDTYNEKNDTNIVGLTNNATRRIYIAESKAVVHEFGHFVQIRYGLDATALYEAEATKLASLTGDYCKKNSREFFAEAFAAYLSPTKNEALRKIAPQTYAFLDALAANFSI